MRQWRDEPVPQTSGKTNGRQASGKPPVRSCGFSCFAKTEPRLPRPRAKEQKKKRSAGREARPDSVWKEPGSNAGRSGSDLRPAGRRDGACAKRGAVPQWGANRHRSPLPLRSVPDCVPPAHGTRRGSGASAASKIAKEKAERRTRSASRLSLVPPGGIEPPTRGFSVPCSTN